MGLSPPASSLDAEALMAAAGPKHPLPPTPACPSLATPAAILDQQLAAMAEGLMPTAADRAKVSAAFDAIREVLTRNFPGCGVMLFGSGATDMAVAGGTDLDVCLALPGFDDTWEAKGEWVGGWVGGPSGREVYVHICPCAEQCCPPCMSAVMAQPSAYHPRSYVYTCAHAFCHTP
jgi:hypothetical protein